MHIQVTLLWYFVSMLASKFNHLITCTLWVSIIALTLVLGCYLLEVSYQRIDASHQELEILRYERYCIYKYYFSWSFTSNLASKDWPVGNMCRSGLPIWLWLQYLLGSLLRYHNKISEKGHLHMQYMLCLSIYICWCKALILYYDTSRGYQASIGVRVKLGDLIDTCY